MARKYVDQKMQETYDSCIKNRPTTSMHGIGQAFFYGYENPETKPTSPRCGLAGSVTRAAWAAGVDCRRADDKAKSKTTATQKG